MANWLQCISARNFRCLADVEWHPGSLSVLFGPNGSGKSTLLDTIWFVRDCAIRGVDAAAADRSHGIGALWDGADDGANISITVETISAQYTVSFGYSSGRIEPFVGEDLFLKNRKLQLVRRIIGSDKAEFYFNRLDQHVSVTLREPEKLALTKYVDFTDSDPEADEIDRLLHFIHFYHARFADFYGLKKRGSQSHYHTHVWDRYQNLWSVLRNLHDKRNFDDRYETIIGFMRECFPSFKDLLFEQTGPESIYGSFIDRRRRHPIQASGVSDGHLQMLAHLTCLFSECQDRDSLIIFDEPDISLHPHALFIFAKAAKVAAASWSKQILMSTHSPVLISQFEPAEVVATNMDDTGRTVLRRVSDMPEVQDLLRQYAIGSLYMAELIGAQSQPTRENGAMTVEESKMRGFRWPAKATANLPDGSPITIEPISYLSQREEKDMTDQQKKLLRLYRVFQADGSVIREISESDLESLLTS